MERIKHYQSEKRKGIAEEGILTDQDLATKAETPLIDSATGKKLIVRVFDFNWNKGMKKQDIERIKNDKQGFFNSHAKYVKDFLWKDGLSVREDHDPKMIFNKKGYRIAVLCEARFGVNIFEKPTTLQDIMKPFSSGQKHAKKRI